MKYLTILVLSLFLISAVSAQLNYNNPRLPRIQAPEVTVTTSSGGSGGNVTSVSSSTNCITVNPTTGDVILTFNSSCSGTSGNPFNQDLNTTNRVVFANVNSTGNLSSSTGVLFNPIDNVFAISHLNHANVTNFAFAQTGGANGHTHINSPTDIGFHILDGDHVMFIDRNRLDVHLRGNFSGDLYVNNNTLVNTWLYNQTMAINPFNQNLNTTNSPTFAGATINGMATIDNPAGLGDFAKFTILGGFLQVGKLTSENGYMQFMGQGVDTYFGNTSASYVGLTTAGDVLIGMLNNYKLIDTSGVNIESNASRTTFYRNTTIQNNITLKDRLNGWLGFSCGTNQSLKQWWLNGTSECIYVNQSGGGGTTNNYYNVSNYYFNQTSTTFNQSTLLFGGFSGTAVNLATRSYVSMVGGSDTVNTVYANRMINLTNNGYLTNFKFNLNGTSIRNQVNATIEINGGVTNITCVTGTNQFCFNNSLIYFDRNSTMALSIRSNSTVPLSNFHYSVEYLRNITINVSAPIYNVVSNDITGTTALDTTYNNTYGRPAYIDVSFTSTGVNGLDTAILDAYANGTFKAQEGIDLRNLNTDGFTTINYNHLGFYVQPNEKWSLNSSVAGSGVLSLTKVVLTTL